MSGLPLSWVETDLDDVCSLIRGITFPSSAKESNHTPSNVCCLRTSNIQREVGWDDIYFVSQEYVKRDDQFVQSGDILMSMANSYELVGKVAVVRNVPYTTAFGAFLAAIRPRVGVHGQYLFHLLRTAQVQSELRSGSSQTVNIANISVKALSSIQIPLAPLHEQQRIADKLDVLLTKVDACRARLDRVPQILNRFRQAVLSAATSGQLTEEWRESTRCSTYDIPSLLSKERANKWIARGKYKPAIQADEVESTEFSHLPDIWHRGTLDQITWSVKDGPHFSPRYEESGIPFISGGSVKPGKVDLSIAKFISPELHKEFSTRCKPEIFDILYTKGGTTGLAAVNTLKDDFNVWVHVAVLKLVSAELVNPFFVQYALNSPECYSQSQRYTHGVGNQDLGLTRMIKIVLPVPPIEEQHEIVRRVETLFDFADRLEARYTSARKQVDQLTPSLLAKAFRGELVPQDPNDEPAEKLLERIRTAHVTCGNTETKARRSKTPVQKREPS